MAQGVQSCQVLIIRDKLRLITAGGISFRIWSMYVTRCVSKKVVEQKQNTITQEQRMVRIVEHTSLQAWSESTAENVRQMAAISERPSTSMVRTPNTVALVR